MDVTTLHQIDEHPRAAFPFIAFRAEGTPYARALRCTECGASFSDFGRLACARCGARDTLEEIEVAATGTLHSFTIVHRAFAGTATPFVSVIVNLDNGVTLKGSLRGIAFDPQTIRMGMRVKLVFDDALGRVDAQGHRYISHFFEPA